MNKYKICFIIISLLLVFQFQVAGQVVPDSIIIAELENEYEDKKKKLEDYQKNNLKRLRQATKTSEEYSTLESKIYETLKKIKQTNQLIEFDKLKYEYDSLKSLNEMNIKTLIELDSILEIDSLKLDTLNEAYLPLEQAKNLLFGISIEVAHQKIERYLRNEPYNQETNDKLIKTIREGDKYFRVLNNYCAVSREAYIIMQSTILFGKTANKTYKSKYKPKTLKWKDDYPWLYKQFIIKEKEMDREIFKEQNLIPKVSCKSQ